MGCARRGGLAGLVVCILGLVVGTATAQDAPGLFPRVDSWLGEPLPLAQLPAAARDVLEHPTLAAKGPAEVFVCRPAVYHWLLDHPDRAVTCWKRLGVKCVDVEDRGDGRFGWTDGSGSDVGWVTVFRGPRLRVWFAEGRVKPAPLLPPVSVQVVLVLRHSENSEQDGSAVVGHRAEFAIRTDSKTAALATRLLGSSASRLAEQYMGQLQLFYSALAWYLDQHPRQVESLLSDRRP